MSHSLNRTAFLFFGIVFFGFSAVFLFASEAQAITVVESQVSSSADDAYHAPLGGWPGYSHSDIYNGIYAGRPGGNGAVWGGWRWAGFSIPTGSVIISAYVEFTQREWGWEIPNNVALESSANPAVFSATNSPYHRWTNAKTAFQRSWQWIRSSPGAIHRTPELSAGIQELVDTHGSLTALVLLEDGSPVLSQSISHQ